MSVRAEFENILLIERVASRGRRVAFEHSSPEALAKYLEDNPGADRSKHTVKKDDGGGGGGGGGDKAPGKKEAPKSKPKRPKRETQSEIEFLRDSVENPKDNGLDPDDPDDKKTIESMKKEIARQERMRGEGSLAKHERKEHVDRKKTIEDENESGMSHPQISRDGPSTKVKSKDGKDKVLVNKEIAGKLTQHMKKHPKDDPFEAATKIKKDFLAGQAKERKEEADKANAKNKKPDISAPPDGKPRVTGPTKSKPKDHGVEEALVSKSKWGWSDKGKVKDFMTKFDKLSDSAKSEMAHRLVKEEETPEELAKEFFKK